MVYKLDPFDGITEKALRGKLKERYTRYHKAIESDCNCLYWSDIRQTVSCIVARKPILAGEELLMPYGFTYWLERHYGVQCATTLPWLKKALNAMDTEKKLLISGTVYDASL